MTCHTPASRIQTQASHETIDDVKQTARLLASDIADYICLSRLRHYDVVMQQRCDVLLVD